jgi:hypothetical protein
VGEKWVSDDCSYLCKGLLINNPSKNMGKKKLKTDANLQKPTFHPLGDFLNPALALLGQGLKKSPIGQKLDFANRPYLCKGLS